MFFSEEVSTVDPGLCIPCTGRKKTQRLRVSGPSQSDFQWKRSVWRHPVHRKAIFNEKRSAWRHPIHRETFSQQGRLHRFALIGAAALLFLLDILLESKNHETSIRYKTSHGGVPGDILALCLPAHLYVKASFWNAPTFFRQSTSR